MLQNGNTIVKRFFKQLMPINNVEDGCGLLWLQAMY